MPSVKTILNLYKSLISFKKLVGSHLIIKIAYIPPFIVTILDGKFGISMGAAMDYSHDLVSLKKYKYLLNKSSKDAWCILSNLIFSLSRNKNIRYKNRKSELSIALSISNAIAQYIFEYLKDEMQNWLKEQGITIGNKDIHTFVNKILSNYISHAKREVYVTIIGYGGPIYLRNMEGVHIRITDLWPKYYTIVDVNKNNVITGPKYLFGHDMNHKLIKQSDVVVITASAVTSDTMEELLNMSLGRPIIWIYGKSSNPFLSLCLKNIAEEIAIVSWSQYKNIEGIFTDLEWHYRQMFEGYMDEKRYSRKYYIYFIKSNMLKVL